MCLEYPDQELTELYLDRVEKKTGITRNSALSSAQQAALYTINLMSHFLIQWTALTGEEILDHLETIIALEKDHFCYFQVIFLAQLIDCAFYSFSSCSNIQH